MSRWDVIEVNEAIKNGKKRDVVQFLNVNPGYDINQLDDEEYGAIHYALDAPNSIEMIELLLNKGADVNLKTPDESTGLNSFLLLIS